MADPLRFLPEAPARCDACTPGLIPSACQTRICSWRAWRRAAPTETPGPEVGVPARYRRWPPVDHHMRRPHQTCPSVSVVLRRERTWEANRHVARVRRTPKRRSQTSPTLLRTDPKPTAEPLVVSQTNYVSPTSQHSVGSVWYGSNSGVAATATSGTRTLRRFTAQTQRGFDAERTGYRLDRHRQQEQRVFRVVPERHSQRRIISGSWARSVSRAASGTKTGPSAPGAQRIGRVQSAFQVHNVTETPHAGARAARGWTLERERVTALGRYAAVVSGHASYLKPAAYSDNAVGQPSPLCDLWIACAFRNLGRGVF